MVDFPEGRPTESNDISNKPTTYNDRLTPVEAPSKPPAPKSAMRLWFDDIWYSLSRDILKPTLKNLLYQMINTGARVAIYHRGGGPQGGYGPGYDDYYDYRAANDSRDRGGASRFNSNDRFGGYSNEVGRVTAANWRRECGFSDQASAEIALRRLKDRCNQRRVVTIGDYCDISGKTNFDWTLDRYGWRNIDNAYVKYEMFGDPRKPFHIVFPYEEYLGQ